MHFRCVEEEEWLRLLLQPASGAVGGAGQQEGWFGSGNEDSSNIISHYQAATCLVDMSAGIRGGFRAVARQGGPELCCNHTGAPAVRSTRFSSSHPTTIRIHDAEAATAADAHEYAFLLHPLAAWPPEQHFPTLPTLVYCCCCPLPPLVSRRPLAYDGPPFGALSTTPHPPTIPAGGHARMAAAGDVR